VRTARQARRRGEAPGAAFAHGGGGVSLDAVDREVETGAGGTPARVGGRGVRRTRAVGRLGHGGRYDDDRAAVRGEGEGESGKGQSRLATLLPIFAGEVSRTYLPWAFANAASASQGRKRFSVTFDDGLFEQATQAYAARAFGNVRAEVAARMGDAALPAFLEAAGASTFFR
jgi:hypothetical protein